MIVWTRVWDEWLGFNSSGVKPGERQEEERRPEGAAEESDVTAAQDTNVLTQNLAGRPPQSKGLAVH